MKKKKFTIETYEEFTFFFKHEPDLPDLLHMYVRHLTTTGDAIQTFLTGDTLWHENRRRFETFTSTHCIYWLWLDERSKKILIITCFTI